jgi:hypothetical protein
MAWDFLRRFFKLMGGKIMGKLAPRLLFFQYYNRAGLELEEQKKKFRILYQKSHAELLVYELMTRKRQYRIGFSSLVEEDHRRDNEVSIIEVHGSEDCFYDDKTISSSYESDVGLDDLEPPEFIEMYARV